MDFNRNQNKPFINQNGFPNQQQKPNFQNAPTDKSLKIKQIQDQQQVISDRISSYLQQHNEEFIELQKNGVKQGFSWRSVSKEVYQLDFDITGGQNFGKSKQGWVWYKNLTIPMLTISLSKNQDSMMYSDTLFANIYCMKKLRCQSYSQVKLLEDQQQTFQDGNANFKSLKFTETTLMSRSNFFILILYITNNQGDILGIKISPPFQVDGRRKYWMERESVAQVLMPFPPEKLERNFEKVDKKENSITHIGDDLKSLFDYYSSQTIRRKIRHPMYLLLRFPKAVKFYINTNLIQAQDNAMLIKKIHQEIDTALKIQAKGADQNIGIENKPLLLQLRASQQDKVQQSFSNKMAKYLYVIDSVACQYQSTIQEVPEYFLEVPFSYELKDQYKKVHYQLTPFKGIEEDMDVSEFYDNDQSEIEDKINNTQNSGTVQNKLPQAQSQSQLQTQQQQTQDGQQNFSNINNTTQNSQYMMSNNTSQLNPGNKKDGEQQQQPQQQQWMDNVMTTGQDMQSLQNSNMQLNNSMNRTFAAPMNLSNTYGYSKFGMTGLNNSHLSFKMNNMNNSYCSNGQYEVPQFDTLEPLMQQSELQQQGLQPQQQQNGVKMSQSMSQTGVFNTLNNNNNTNNNNKGTTQVSQNQQKNGFQNGDQGSSQQQQQDDNKTGGGNGKQFSQPESMCYFCQQHLAEQNQKYLEQRLSKYNGTLPTVLPLWPKPAQNYFQNTFQQIEQLYGQNLVQYQNQQLQLKVDSLYQDVQTMQQAPIMNNGYPNQMQQPQNNSMMLNTSTTQPQPQPPQPQPQAPTYFMNQSQQQQQQQQQQQPQQQQNSNILQQPQQQQQQQFNQNPTQTNQQNMQQNNQNQQRSFSPLFNKQNEFQQLNQQQPQQQQQQQQQQMGKQQSSVILIQNNSQMGNDVSGQQSNDTQQQKQQMNSDNSILVDGHNNPNQNNILNGQKLGLVNENYQDLKLEINE